MAQSKSRKLVTGTISAAVIASALAPVAASASSATITTVYNPSTKTVYQGQKVSLPSTVTVKYSNGKKASAKVKWGKVSTSVGTHKITGDVAGTSKNAYITVVVKKDSIKTVGSFAEFKVVAGTTAKLPSAVKVVNYSGKNTTAAVKWPTVSTAKVGSTTIKGTVSGTTKTVSIKVTVTAPTVKSASVVNAKQVSVTFSNAKTVPVTLTSALQDGATTVSFSYYGYSYKSVKLVSAYNDPAVAAYNALKQAAEKSVSAYEALANGDLSTQDLVTAAKQAGSSINLTGLNAADTASFNKRISDADAKVTAAQKALDDAAAYATLKQAAQDSVKAYEALAQGNLSTQDLVDAAKVAGSKVDLSHLTDADAQVLQLRVAAADSLVKAAQAKLDAATEYQATLTKAQNDVAAYEALANGELTTQAELDAANAAKAVIHLDALNDADKAPLALRVAAADALVKAAQDYLNLPVAESAVATNASTVQVTLPTDSKLAETDLAGKVITLKSGDTSLTATYVAGSLANGTANFALASGNSLVDATTYTLSADWIKFTTNNFVAKVAAAYAQTFDKQTSAVLSTDGNTNVYFTAKNQYGEAINVDSTNTSGVTVKATLNGMPLSSSEVSYTPGDNFVTVKHSLAADDQLVITLVSNKVESNLSYTVVKATTDNASVPSSLQVSADKTTIASGNTANLTVTVKDQYNNPVKVNDGDIRWFVDGVEDTTQTGATYVFKNADSKSYNVQAFYKNKSKLSQGVTINVGAAELKSLDVVPVSGTVYNQEDANAFTVTQNTGALLNPSDLKYVVTGMPTSATASDVKVTFAYGQDDPTTPTDESKIIYAKVNTDVAGTYKFKVFTGTAVDAKDAVVSSEQSLTSFVRQDVTAINVDDFATNELTAGKEVVKAISFTNKHGEAVDVTNDQLKVASTSNMTVKLLNKDKVDTSTATDKVVKYVSFTGAAAGQDTVTIVKGSVSKTITPSTQSASAVSTIDATGLTGDNAVVAGDTGAKYIALNVADQYNVPVLDTSKLAVKVKAPGASSQFEASNFAKLVYLDKDNNVTQTQANAVKVAVAIDPSQVAQDDSGNLISGDYTVQISDAATGKVAKEVTVTANPARTLDTVTATASSQQFALNSKGSITFVPKDQYGNFIALGDSPKATVKSDDNGSGVLEGITSTEASQDLTPVTVTNSDGTTRTVGYKLNVTAATKGNATLTFTIGGKTVNVNVNVDSVDSLVNSVKLSTVDTQKSLYNDSSAVALNTTAYNSTGNQVPVSNSDLNYTVDSVNGTVTNGNGATVAATSSAASVSTDGKVTVDPTFKGKVIVKVTSANLKTSTLGLNFDDADSAPVTGTTAVKDVDAKLLDSDSTKDGIQVALDGQGTDEKDGSVSFALTAVDQYGNTVPVDDTAAKVTTGDSSVLTIDHTDPSDIKVTAKGAGDANVYVQYNGDTIVLNFHVTKEAVAAVNAAADLAAATPVKEEISALPEKSAVQLSDESVVSKARSDYDGITADQKSLVGEITKLTDAEAQIANLKVDTTIKSTGSEVNVDNNTHTVADSGTNLTSGTTTAEELLSYVATNQPGETVQVFDSAKTAEITGSSTVSTGDILVVTSADGKTTQNYTVTFGK